MDIKPSRPSRVKPLQIPSIPEPSLPPEDRKPRINPLRIGIITLVGIIALCAVAGIWYSWAIAPVSSQKSTVRVVVDEGDTARDIAKKLKQDHLIKNSFAFEIYTKITRTRNKLQAGGYVLSKDQSVKKIVDHLVTGKTDEFNITILPGMSLNELRELFKSDGFSESEITTAYNASYHHPLLASKPEGTSLEGYLYPETYRMNADQSLQELFYRSFDQFYKLVQEKQYVQAFAAHNLTLYQGFTLASIVQKEVSDAPTQKQVAQVFLSRLSTGSVLGSDVTFIYAAKQLGVASSPSLDSPYNTRKYPGLPPGPIANMNPSALEAVAHPAPGDFLYFVAGDDGTTYFSHTEAEHDANVAAHCKKLCSL
jgi:UPF0755 protein